MLELTEFKKPLITFHYGGPQHYKRKYPTKLNQIFPMPTLNKPQPQPRISFENIKLYPCDIFGNRLYYNKQ